MSNFIENFWEKNKHLWGGELITRFPPEPNGLLHIGHAKALSVSGGIAEKFGGRMNLRMDDTNPENEDEYFTKMIIEIVDWLGYNYGNKVFYASDYFPIMYEFAKKMIENDLAYVDFSNKDKISEMRGTLTSPGIRSLDSENSIEWHLNEFENMKNGIYSEGFGVLRAKLDMSNPNINMRDPVMYRIKKMAHIRTGSDWCIYSSYGFAHPIEDWLEKVSLSLCTLEFEDQRPFYDHIISMCEKFLPKNGAKHFPVELEFARLELDRGLTSKRKINALVEAGKVDGFDDPRLVTLVALRRRGFTPSSLRKFCEEAGVSKANSIIPFSRVEDCLRVDLDEKAVRRVVIAKPVLLKVIGDLPTFSVKASNHPKIDLGERDFEVSSSMWIDVDDVRLAGMAEKGFKRVEPGAVFRIMYTGLIYECIDVVPDENGNISSVTVKVVTDKKPRVAIHGLSVDSAVSVEILEPDVIPSEDVDSFDYLVVKKGYCEAIAMETEGTFQAVRYGWVVKDRNNPGRLILATSLRNSHL